MRTSIRRKLEMAAAVRQFGRDNPSDDPGYAVMMTGLEDLVGRAQTLAAREFDGRVSEAAAVGRRDQIKRTLHFLLLRHIVSTAELAAKDHPELAGRFPSPSFKAANSSYLIFARRLLQEARAAQQVLAGYGLSAPMLEELAATISLFEAAIADQRSGRSGHVGARAELEGLGSQILGRVVQFDSFNRGRFRNDPERLAAWENVRTVLGLDRARAESGDETPAPVVEKKEEPAA